MSKRPKTTPEIARLRARMDRLNALLAEQVQARARLALAIGRKKAELGAAAADPRREREMLARVLRSAPAGLPRRDLARVFTTIFAASRSLVVRDRRRRVG